MCAQPRALTAVSLTTAPYCLGGFGKVSEWAPGLEAFSEGQAPSGCLLCQLDVGAQGNGTVRGDGGRRGTLSNR